jgi:hypothetical protein
LLERRSQATPLWTLVGVAIVIGRLGLALLEGDVLDFSSFQK